MGAPERNSAAAAQVVPHGSVMYNHCFCHSFTVSTKVPLGEAFLRIQPHFGLWLKVFNVKPKVVDGQHAECGGAMVSKLSNIS